MSKIDNKKIKAYWSKQPHSLTIEEEGEELNMRDEEYKEMLENEEIVKENKKGILELIKKHKISVIATLAALGVALGAATYKNTNDKDNEMTNDSKLEDVINKVKPTPNDSKDLTEDDKELADTETIEETEEISVEEPTEQVPVQEQQIKNNESKQNVVTNNSINNNNNLKEEKNTPKEEFVATMDMLSVYYNPDIYYTILSVLQRKT